MTDQNIEQLARHRKVPSWVLKLVADAIAHEREACAKVCETHGSMARHAVWMAEECAALIRARGNL